MLDLFQSIHPVHYLPVLTTIFSLYFFIEIFGRYRKKGGTHLFWWSAGVFTYGLGTFLESAITIFGNSPLLNKSWYVAGAILGGYPLAQGSVYLHFKKRNSDILSSITIPFILFAAVCVFLSPVNLSLLETFRPGGASIGWQWVRLLTPLINLYAAIFLIGTALLSAIRFAKVENGKNRAFGNLLITIGAILPGIGGGMAKAGMVEALYVGEFVGIILIFLGYRACLREKPIFQL
ncbi:MAG: hypothetical protein OEM82_03135 [Acidobacteriota bacterium]|nr:hypothetical protein [Acidobacteriota bacterium]MDH3530247.1 hypothetical protein [Acidobacteriota bacterium]